MWRNSRRIYNYSKEKNMDKKFRLKKIKETRNYLTEEKRMK